MQCAGTPAQDTGISPWIHQHMDTARAHPLGSLLPNLRTHLVRQCRVAGSDVSGNEEEVGDGYEWWLTWGQQGDSRPAQSLVTQP